jgi:hypothetical protein
MFYNVHGSGIMERERIIRLLRAQLAASQDRRDQAAKRFDEMMREVPSGIPHPDGTERIRQISNEYGRTQAEASAAFGRLNDFLIHGKIPPNLTGNQK